MSWFQLDPSALASRCSAAVPPPTLAASIGRGIVGFTLLSVAGFAPWAIFGRWLHRHVGEAGLYIVCALVFIGLSGLLLHRLILGSGSLQRFYQLFSIAFTVYAVAWIVAWIVLRGNAGGLGGLLIGTVLMGWILTTAFEARGAVVVKVIAALFVLNASGYLLGGVIEAALSHHQALAAKLLWGVSYGVGFGAGLGWAFYLCQTSARALLATPAPETSR